jgi:hypothetical protein
METQVLVRYFDKAWPSALVEWCSCSPDDPRVSVQYTRGVVQSLLWNTVVYADG